MGCVLSASLKRTTTPTYGVESGWKLPFIPQAEPVNSAKVTMIGRIAIVHAFGVFMILFSSLTIVSEVIIYKCAVGEAAHTQSLYMQTNPFQQILASKTLNSEGFNQWVS
jgi:hypothetical protein